MAVLFLAAPDWKPVEPLSIEWINTSEYIQFPEEMKQEMGTEQMDR